MSNLGMDLAAQWFHPVRPTLEAARAAIAAIAEPRAAWRRLAELGIIPGEFVDGKRRFAASSDVALAPSTREVLEGWVFGEPPTRAAVLSFAADPGGMLVAERACAELFARLEPWGAEPPSQVRWLCAPQSHPQAVTLNGAYVIALDSLDASLEEAGLPLVQWMPSEGVGLPHIARRAIAAEEGWRAAISGSLSVSRACWPPERLAGRPFAELASPFESLTRLWATGYLLDVGEGRDDVWLVAPEV